MDNTIKKESEVTNVTNLGDNDSIRATLANGQSVSIKKSDLMPVLVEGIGKWLGNSDVLSTFTNVLVNNGQTLGKATIENLASVVSGENIILYRNGDIYQLTNIYNPWHRSTVRILGSYNGTPIDLTIGTMLIPDRGLAVSKYGSIINNFKFYTDGSNLFIKILIEETGIGQMISYSFGTENGYYQAKNSNISFDRLSECNF